MNFMTMLPFIVVIVFVIVLVVRRRDNGKPKEGEATITAKNETGGIYSFTFDLKGEKKTLSTREAYYNKLQVGQTGIVAYRGKTLLDFEPFQKR